MVPGKEPRSTQKRNLAIGMSTLVVIALGYFYWSQNMISEESLPVGATGGGTGESRPTMSVKPPSKPASKPKPPPDTANILPDDGNASYTTGGTAGGGAGGGPGGGGDPGGGGTTGGSGGPPPVPPTSVNAKDVVDAPAAWGVFSWKLPRSITKDIGADVYAFVDPTNTPGRPGASQPIAVMTSERMKVSMKSVPPEDMTFQPLGEEDQVLNQGAAQWKWHATPNRLGKICVQITATRYLNTNVGIGPQTTKSAQRYVTVEANEVPPEREPAKPLVNQLADTAKDIQAGAAKKAKEETSSALGTWIAGGGILAAGGTFGWIRKRLGLKSGKGKKGGKNKII